MNAGPLEGNGVDLVLRSGLTYDRELLVCVLKEMIEKLGGWPKSFFPGARVLLKVNMLAAKAPERGITTHPEVVASLVILLRELGCIVSVGDSPGGAIRGVERYWKNCGYADLSRELNFDLVNFEKSGSVTRISGGFNYNIAKPVFEYDALINVCKFKTHMYCRLTNAVKNVFGIVPGMGKSVIHSYAVRPKDLAIHILNLYSLVHFDLVIMDAILAMDGKGPSTDGHTRWDGILGAARDGVVMDTVMAHLVGLKPEELDTNREAWKRGFGKPLEDIVIDGSASFDEFRIPRTSIFNIIPPFLGGIIRPFIRSIPRSTEWCTGCGICEKSCPVDAITIVNGRAKMNRKTCIVCFCCHELCPENAIVIRHPLGRN